MEKAMKWRFTFLGLFFALVLCPFSSPIDAQTAETAAKTSALLWYDITKEVTITGTVTGVVRKAAPEMKMLGGSHLIVKATSGEVIDASLGRFAMEGEGTVTVASGEQIQLTGVVRVINDKEVLFTRLVRTNGHLYKVRNEHGYALAPEPANASAGSDTEGSRQ
jgi:hypothetical protein